MAVSPILSILPYKIHAHIHVLVQQYGQRPALCCHGGATALLHDPQWLIITCRLQLMHETVNKTRDTSLVNPTAGMSWHAPTIARDISESRPKVKRHAPKAIQYKCTSSQHQWIGQILKFKISVKHLHSNLPGANTPAYLHTLLTWFRAMYTAS